MSAVLRAYGENFDVDAFLKDCTLPVCSIKRRGEPIRPTKQTDGRIHERSGVHIIAADAEFNGFSKQIGEAIQFLKNEVVQLHRLCNWPGVTDLSLDFEIEKRSVAVQCDAFPAELVRLAAEYGLGLELTQYS